MDASEREREREREREGGIIPQFGFSSCTSDEV